MYWLGLQLSNVYVYMQLHLEETWSKRTAALVCGGMALLLFLAGGGPSLLWRDPWLLSAAVMPGFDIAWPHVREWMEARVARATGEQPDSG
jgi:hypothetical protein